MLKEELATRQNGKEWNKATVIFTQLPWQPVLSIGWMAELSCMASGSKRLQLPDSDPVG